jgi:Lar family restriction alleviation protein
LYYVVKEIEMLIPCPFCGNVGFLNQDNGFYRAECLECGVAFPWVESKEEAIRAWNQRQ